jgi:hypothetical protein
VFTTLAADPSSANVGYRHAPRRDGVTVTHVRTGNAGIAEPIDAFRLLAVELA